MVITKLKTKDSGIPQGHGSSDEVARWFSGMQELIIGRCQFPYYAANLQASLSTEDVPRRCGSTTARTAPRIRSTSGGTSRPTDACLASPGSRRADGHDNSPYFRDTVAEAVLQKALRQEEEEDEEQTGGVCIMVDGERRGMETEAAQAGSGAGNGNGSPDSTAE